MAGTVAGGKKAAATNLKKNPNFYKEIGSIGGRAKVPNKGFAANPELARIAGQKGGKISRRGSKKVEPEVPTNFWGKLFTRWGSR